VINPSVWSRRERDEAGEGDGTATVQAAPECTDQAAESNGRAQQDEVNAAHKEPLKKIQLEQRHSQHLAAETQSKQYPAEQHEPAGKLLPIGQAGPQREDKGCQPDAGKKGVENHGRLTSGIRRVAPRLSPNRSLLFRQQAVTGGERER
jgi:hypothetical protein